jgi:RNA polymerase sigma factor (sigma-70 family)
MTHQDYSTEPELLSQLQQSSLNGPVTKLYELYYEPVTYWLQSQGAGEQDAADIFQETVLVLIEQVRQNKFRGESKLNTYLTGIARNLWLNEQRSRLRRNNREEVFAEAMETATEPDAQQRIYSRENRQKLMTLFEQIGNVCKSILAGYYFEKRSMKELLVVTNFENEQVLRNKKSKCMKHLKDLIMNNSELTETFKTYLNYDQ